VRKQDALLARIVDYQGTSSLSGLHSHPLSLAEAAGIAQQMRSRLRRKSVVPAERLRKEATGVCLIRYWEEAVERRSLRTAPPPVLPSAGSDGPPPRGEPDNPE
jgi:hypothetical protein